MAGLEIRQVTFVPFVFSGPWKPGAPGWTTFIERLRANANASHANLTDAETSLFAPTKPAKLLLDCAGSSLAFYFFPVGVGVCQVHWPAHEEDRPATPEEILTTRKQRHQEVLRGTAGVGARVHTIIALARRDARPDVVLPPFTLQGSKLCPYAFSSYFIHARPEALQEECKRVVSALLEPSRLGITDSEWPEIAAVEDPSETTGHTPSPAEWDLRASVHCHMSWASVVASTTKDLDPLIALYATLECRLQAAWCLSHVLGCIDGFHQKLSGYEAELLSATLETGIRELAPLRDPTASERIKRLYEGMIQTSGLTTKITEARENIAMLRAFAAARALRQRERFELVTEVLLFVLVCLQLLPLFRRDPLEGTARTIVVIGVSIGAVIYMVVRWLIRK